MQPIWVWGTEEGHHLPSSAAVDRFDRSLEPLDEVSLEARSRESEVLEHLLELRYFQVIMPVAHRASGIGHF